MCANQSVKIHRLITLYKIRVYIIGISHSVNNKAPQAMQNTTINDSLE